MDEQLNLLSLTAAEVRQGREFEVDDTVIGSKFLGLGKLPGPVIQGKVTAVGNKYLRLDTGDIFKGTAKFQTQFTQLKIS